MEWIYLILAIAFEISATTWMKMSNGFTKILPTVGTFLGYIICFTFLSMALKKIDMGVVPVRPHQYENTEALDVQGLQYFLYYEKFAFILQ